MEYDKDTVIKTEAGVFIGRLTRPLLPSEKTDWDGTIYAVVTFKGDPWNVSVGDWNFIGDMEFLDEPPRWFLKPLAQTCFIGNVNGGDSRPYDNEPDIIAHADSFGLSLEEFVDGNDNKWDTPPGG